MAEVYESLQQLGMRACPVCGSAESLSISPLPVVLVEGAFPAGADDLPLGEDGEGDLTFAVRAGCATCGYLMLFDSARYRTGDEKIMVLGLETESQREQ